MNRFINTAFGRLLLVNVAAFVVVHIIAFVSHNSWFMSQLGVSTTDFHWWTLLTYMVVHSDVLQLLFNMLWLYWFGQFFMTLGTERQMLWLYVGGGIVGALSFVVMGAAGVAHGTLFGASASVLAVVVGAAWRTPNLSVNLLLLGSVAIKWIALVLVLLSVVSLSGANAGGNVAHLGGAVAGMVYGMVMRRGGFAWRGLSRRSGAKSEPSAAEDSERLDSLLEKVRRSGYASLTSVERRDLIELSKKI